MSDNPYVKNKNLKIYLNGELVGLDEAKISVFDHGLLYGDGVFEGIRSYNGRVFELDAHMRRLCDGAKTLRLEIPLSVEQFKESIYQTLKANGLDAKDAYIRAVVTRGVGYLGLHPAKTVNPSVFIITDECELYPPELYETGMELVTVATIRNHPAALSPRVKSLNYLNNILAQIECVDAGCVEGIMLNHEGHVAECTGDNIFILRDGELQTPPTSAGILEGITRSVVIRLAKRRGIPAQEKQLLRYDLYASDECFLTGSAAEIAPIIKIDGRVIGTGKPGKITLELLEDFRAVTRGELALA